MTYPTKTQYKLINNYVVNLVSDIQYWLDDGWLLLGAPTFLYIGNSVQGFQALTKIVDTNSSLAQK